jgi:putative transposase
MAAADADTLQALDLLLAMVAVPRVVHRDRIHFSSLRYLNPVLAEHVGRSVTIRYDPRDISEIRALLDDRFLCRAISPQHADETITLKGIQVARTRRRLHHTGRIRRRTAA